LTRCHVTDINHVLSRCHVTEINYVDRGAAARAPLQSSTKFSSHLFPIPEGGGSVHLKTQI